jgi:hypothetical protein
VSATGFLNPALQFFDGNGDPLDGGLIYTYVAGTSTPATTYFASDLLPGSANTNPVQCSSAGRCVIYPPTPAALKIIVKTSAGVTVYTQDNISPAAVAV